MKLLYYSFLLCSSAQICYSLNKNVSIIVKDNKLDEENPPYLMREPDESLILVCEIRQSQPKKISYNLTWTLPDKSQNRPRDSTNDDGSVKLVIDHVQENDSGYYKCEAVNETQLSHTVQLFVKSTKLMRTRTCEKMFDCDATRTQCIPQIYTCDGKIDCKTKKDESPELCGEDPCVNRIRCSNGRCIPQAWCFPCDADKANCTNKVRHECCPETEYIKYYGRHYDHYDSNVHYNDMHFLQTTLFTVIGCAMVFMIIVTILVIAICRVHMKRTLQTHVTNNRRPHSAAAYHPALTQELVCDLDLTSNRSEGLGLLVTYNINNGVQIVGGPVEPPPYSEVASLPPREGPPPPYTLYLNSENENAQLAQTQNSRNVSSAGLPKNRLPNRSGMSNVRVASEPSLHRL